MSAAFTIFRRFTSPPSGATSGSPSVCSRPAPTSTRGRGPPRRSTAWGWVAVLTWCVYSCARAPFPHRLTTPNATPAASRWRSTGPTSPRFSTDRRVSDVDANRAGHITARQRFRLLRGVGSLLFMTGIGLVIAIALGPNLLNAFGNLGIFGGLLVTIFFLMCVVMTFAGGLGVVFVLGDAVLGRVSSVTGAPTLRRVAVRTNALARPFPSAYTYQGQYRYKVMVGDKEFA